MQKELSTKEKWAPVDRIIETINERKEKGEEPCKTGLEEYVNANFNKGTKQNG